MRGGLCCQGATAEQLMLVLAVGQTSFWAPPASSRALPDSLPAHIKGF